VKKSFLLVLGAVILAAAPLSLNDYREVSAR